MVTLYWSKGCGSFAPHAALVLTGTAFDLVEIDLDQDEQHGSAFLAVNPRGQVPALVLEDSTVLTESSAILMHLADCYPEVGLLPEPGTTERAIAYRWLVFAVVNLYEASCHIADTENYTDDLAGYKGIREKARKDLDSYWSMVEEAIGEGPFFFGATISAVDISLAMITRWHPDKDELFARRPKLKVLCDAVSGHSALEPIWKLNFSG